MIDKLSTAFADVFGESKDARYYFAPGRVNLIGEHTDYNGGHVFPCALTIGIYAAARPRDDRRLRFYSLNYQDSGVIETSLDELAPDERFGWTNYAKGVIWAFAEKGQPLDKGFDMLVHGTLPTGSSLSSSACLEVLTGFILRDLGSIEATNEELAIIGQYAENHYNGVNCGIMDQFAISMGKKGHAIFLDTSDLSYRYAPLTLPHHKIIIASSNKKRGLVDSEYNKRRNECERALADLQKTVQIASLGDLSEEEFEAHKAAIADEVCLRRARHAVYENQRTIRAMDALENGDIGLFGKLMNASHISLRDDYEVTVPETDTLVEEAWKMKGVIGSRMTGGGFGGCTVSIVESDMAEEFAEKIGQTYLEKFGYQADFYTVDAGGGPVRLFV